MNDSPKTMATSRWSLSNPSTKTLLGISILFLVVLISIYLRASHYKISLADPDVMLWGTDAYYHTLYTASIVDTFPAVDRFDPSLHYPQGQNILYPGGFHWLTALIAHTFALSNSEHLIRLLCATMPLLYYLIILCAFFWATRTLYSNGGAYLIGQTAGTSPMPYRLIFMIAAIYVSLLPPTIKLTQFGRYDHHVFELLFMLFTFVQAMRIGRLTTKQSMIRSMIFGFMPLLWVQSTLFYLLYALAMFCNKGVPADVRFRTLTMQSTVVTACYLVTTLTLGSLESCSPNELSWFQPLTGGTLAALALACWSYQRGGRHFWLVGSGVLLTLVAAVSIWGRSILQEIGSTLFAANPFVLHAQESRSLGLSDLPIFVSDHGLLAPLLLMLIPAVFLFPKLRPRLWQPPRRSTFLLLVAATALALIQSRFETLLLALTPLALAEYTVSIGMPCIQRLKGGFKLCACLAGIALLFPMSLLSYKPQTNLDASPSFAAVRDGCRFLHGHHRTRHDSSNIGVLSKWDNGHWILYYCHLPTAASPMTASRQAARWNGNVAKLFYEQDMTKLHNKLRSLKIGYIVNLLPNRSVQALADSLGVEGDFLQTDGDQFVFGEDLFRTLQGRLAFGLADRLPQWLQIIYISPPGPHRVMLGGREFPKVVIAEVH